MAPAPNTTGWILSVAARSKCPRCGQGRLFDGFLTFAKTCNVCGLDYAFADTADGPAFFAMMGMGAPVTAFGIWIELAHEPPVSGARPRSAAGTIFGLYSSGLSAVHHQPQRCETPVNFTLCLLAAQCDRPATAVC
jgi:hypothetical protein